MNDPERILIRPGGVGDTLLLAPALHRLHERGISGLTLVGYPSRLEPLARAGLAGRILSLESFLALPDPVPSTTRVDSFFSSLPTHLLGHPGLKVHDLFPPEGAGLHVVEYLAGCLEVELDTRTRSPLRNLIDDSLQRGSVLWIHPGCGGKQKRWPLDRFLFTAGELRREFGLKPVFLLGEAEEDLEADVSASDFEVRRPGSLLEMSSLFAPGDRYLGNDSGPTHLAALAGLDTLAVFGPTDPRVWGPWGERARWIAGADNDHWIESNKVLEKARQWWFDPYSSHS